MLLRSLPVYILKQLFFSISVNSGRIFTSPLRGSVNILPLFTSISKNNKQLLDEVFVISRIIKVEVRVISRSRRLRLITLTETLIILDITKTESNNCFIIHWTKNLEVVFFTDGKQHESREVDMITLGNHALRSYMTWLLVTLTWLPVTLTWLLYNLQVWRHGRWFRKFTVRFRPIRKDLESSMYNNC